MHPAITARPTLALLILLFFSTGAFAQDAGYVSGSVFADIRVFSHTSGVPYYADQFSLDATGIGGGIRIGTFLHPRWSLELSAEFASRTSVDLGNDVRILTFPPLPLDFRASTEFLTVTTTIGFHQPAVGRFRFGYRGGFSFVRGTYESDYQVFPIAAEVPTRAAGLTFPTIVPPQFGQTVTQQHNSGALALAFESAIDLTRRVAVVPELRALVFSAPFSGPAVFLIRPGVAVRWKF